MISVENISKTFGGQAALLPTTLTLKTRATTVLIGPSGCGKSTLLRLIAGLISYDSGRITINGVGLTAGNTDKARHAIGYVIQDGGLFPHLTAQQNVSLLARFLKRPANWIAERVEFLSALVNIPKNALARYPQQLSFRCRRGTLLSLPESVQVPLQTAPERTPRKGRWNRAGFARVSATSTHIGTGRTPADQRAGSASRRAALPPGARWMHRW